MKACVWRVFLHSVTTVIFSFKLLILILIVWISTLWLYLFFTVHLKDFLLCVFRLDNYTVNGKATHQKCSGYQKTEAEWTAAAEAPKKAIRLKGMFYKLVVKQMSVYGWQLKYYSLTQNSDTSWKDQTYRYEVTFCEAWSELKIHMMWT